MTTTAATSGQDAYDSRTRWILIIGGLVLAIIGFGLWIFPVKHSKPAPASAKCTDAAKCWVRVDDAPELLLSSLVVLGVLMTLVGVNNRRITKFTGPAGISFETTASEAEDKAIDKVDTQARTDQLPPTLTELAKLLAGSEARSRTLELEHSVGRALTANELDKVAHQAAVSSVNTLRETIK